MTRPLANDVREAYVIQKQQEARNRVNVEIAFDEKQVERELNRALTLALKKLSK